MPIRKAIPDPKVTAKHDLKCGPTKLFHSITSLYEFSLLTVAAAARCDALIAPVSKERGGRAGEACRSPSWRGELYVNLLTHYLSSHLHNAERHSENPKCSGIKHLSFVTGRIGAHAGPSESALQMPAPPADLRRLLLAGARLSGLTDNVRARRRGRGGPQGRTGE